MARFCSSCGGQMVDTAAFCPGCGKPTGVAATPAPASAQAPLPSSAPAATPPQAAGLQDNVAGLLAYLFFPAIAFLVIEPYNKNKFIRFHSFQALLLEVGWMIVFAILGSLAFLGFFLIPIISLGVTILWVVCMIKAFQNEMFKLPIIGDYAEKFANG